MLGKNNKKSHNNGGVLWEVFIVVATLVTFFVAVEISKEKPKIFSVDPASAIASSQNIKALDVSVMIVPTN